jgi:hypothetical protein
MKSFIKQNYPLLIVLTILLTIILIISIKIYYHNEHHIVYSLDDPYIHMSIAKNFSEYGIWGINKDCFTSTSSSPLWTLILTLLFLVFGVQDIIPLILNVISGLLLVYVLYISLRKFIYNKFIITFALISIIYFAFLPTIIFTGMEHNSHTLFVFLLYIMSFKILFQENLSKLDYYLFFALIFFIPLLRYESIIFVFIIFLLFLLKKKISLAFVILAVCMLPVIIYASISIHHGWYAFPNPIIIKVAIEKLNTIKSTIFFFGYHSILNTISSDIFPLIIGSILVLFLRSDKTKGFWDYINLSQLLFIILTLIHMQYSDIGYFHRYSSYLFTLGLFVISIGIYDWYYNNKIQSSIKSNKIKYLLLSLLLLMIVAIPLNDFAYKLLTANIAASKNIYSQQYQMGLFLNKYYKNDIVAANDIGAINYLADIKCVDIMGLANMDFAKYWKYDNNKTTLKIDELLKKNKVKIAIFYDTWLIKGFKGIPENWIKVAEWQIPNNVICGSDKVSFYVFDHNEVEILSSNLKQFSSELSKDVMQYIFY